MTTRKRNDLHINIPALRKLDTMLLVRIYTQYIYTVSFFNKVISLSHGKIVLLLWMIMKT